jgi:serine/threonine protein kinase
MESEVIQFIVAEIVEALQYLHSVGISHRDIKPENIFVTEKGFLKLGDLGTAGISEHARKTLKMKNHKHKDGIKEAGNLNTFVGTKEYVSPEVLKGKGCSPAADMWSLGVIIFQLYTGFTPFFDADGEFYIFQNIMECKYNIPESVPEVVRDLISKLLILSPEERLNAEQVKEHEFFAEYSFDAPRSDLSPLCTLYDII